MIVSPLRPSWRRLYLFLQRRLKLFLVIVIIFVETTLPQYTIPRRLYRHRLRIRIPQRIILTHFIIIEFAPDQRVFECWTQFIVVNINIIIIKYLPLHLPCSLIAKIVDMVAIIEQSCGWAFAVITIVNNLRIAIIAINSKLARLFRLNL